MTDTGLILLMAAGIYGLRMTGLLLPAITVPPRWEESFRFVPIAMLAALVIITLNGGDGFDSRQVIAATAGGAVAWQTRKMWACIAVGVAVYVVLQLV